jgi:hypothetical protein
MSLFDMQSMEWTPAACRLVFIAGELTLSGLMLIFPCLTSSLYKLEPHTQKVCKSSHLLELGHGSHILIWSFALVGALVSGAQVTCILLLPSMLAWTCYHYSAGGKPHAVLNLAFTVALAYYGFVPFPMVQPLEWTPAAIVLAILVLMQLMAAFPGLCGGKIMNAQYEQNPHLKDQYWDDSEDSGEKAKSYRRARELALAAQLLGGACCEAAAIISGGAQYTCILAALPCTMCGYCHWLRREHKVEKFGAFFSWFFAAVLMSLGIAR